MSTPALFPRPRRGRTRPRPTLLHIEVGRRTAWLHGDRVVALLDAAQITQRPWDHRRRAWMVPASRADDVVTAAEHFQHCTVTVKAVDR
ncbi:hypothetical protein [Geodermatophilus sp. URMC 62]|uniref:hypothetical protein n=1 Tax=Geodermatophilus sp. URMC 62 TaxID=3423414 RepID=UPI00406D0FFB